MDSRRLLYRPEEVAELLGLSRAQVYKLLSSGEIPSVKIGASRRVTPASIEGYIARLTEQAPAA